MHRLLCVYYPASRDLSRPHEGQGDMRDLQELTFLALKMSITLASFH